MGFILTSAAGKVHFHSTLEIQIQNLNFWADKIHTFKTRDHSYR